MFWSWFSTIASLDSILMWLTACHPKVIVGHNAVPVKNHCSWQRPKSKDRVQCWIITVMPCINCPLAHIQYHNAAIMGSLFVLNIPPKFWGISVFETRSAWPNEKIDHTTGLEKKNWLEPCLKGFWTPFVCLGLVIPQDAVERIKYLNIAINK